MEETTFLLPSESKKNDHAAIPRAEGREQQSTQGPFRQAGCLMLLLVLVIWIGHISNNSSGNNSFSSSLPQESPFWRNGVKKESDIQEEALEFSLSLEQELVLYDHWKQYLSLEDLWNRTKEKWENVTQRKNTTHVFDAENIKNHSKILANVSQEKGKEWWDRAHDFFQNISDQVMSQEQQVNQQQQQDGDVLSADDLYLLGSKKQGERPNLYMNHSRAYELLIHHGSLGAYQYSADYFLINQGFEAQVNQAYCAVAASVAILNSLRGLIELPMDPVYDPHPYATQSSVFNDCTDADAIQHNGTFDGILSSPFGLNLESNKAILECNLPSKEWYVQAYHVDPDRISMNEMRDNLKAALLNPVARVMINYDRNSAEQMGGGHFSPIGSYSPRMDAFLIMDVAKYKYPPVWIPTEKLYQSLATVDRCGAWDGPAAQAQLPKELLHPTSISELSTALDMLHCQKAYRGYIVVESKAASNRQPTS